MALGTDVPAATLTSNLEQMKTYQGFPVPVMGHVHGQGVPSSSHRLGTIGPNAQATYALTPDALYEISVFDNGSALGGVPENVLIKPGVTGTTIASLVLGTTDAFLVPTSAIPVFQVHILATQSTLTIGTLSTGAKTMVVFARRLIWVVTIFDSSVLENVADGSANVLTSSNPAGPFSSITTTNGTVTASATQASAGSRSLKLLFNGAGTALHAITPTFTLDTDYRSILTTFDIYIDTMNAAGIVTLMFIQSRYTVYLFNSSGWKIGFTPLNNSTNAKTGSEATSAAMTTGAWHQVQALYQKVNATDVNMILTVDGVTTSTGVQTPATFTHVSGSTSARWGSASQPTFDVAPANNDLIYLDRMYLDYYKTWTQASPLRAAQSVNFSNAVRLGTGVWMEIVIPLFSMALAGIMVFIISKSASNSIASLVEMMREERKEHLMQQCASFEREAALRDELLNAIRSMQSPSKKKVSTDRVVAIPQMNGRANGLVLTPEQED